MKNNFLTLTNLSNLIQDVVLRKLILHKDESGLLVETLRSDWEDIYKNPFAMQYLSVTPSGQIRDKDKWHVHQNQKDRFICISGRIVTALYDNRQNSKTKGQTNLFLMGPGNEAEMYLIVIPKEVYHGFAVVSKEPGYLLNFPDQLYTGEDEGRVDNSQLDWKQVLNDFGI